MESYDPRNPIIKATDDEERAEVHGHIQKDADPTAGKRRLRAHESSDEVQGHNLDDADWRVDVIAIAIPRTGAPIIDHAEDALGW